MYERDGCKECDSWGLGRATIGASSSAEAAAVAEVEADYCGKRDLFAPDNSQWNPVAGNGGKKGPAKY